MSPTRNQEYFSDGLSEELWEIFAHLPELRVGYRTSAFAFKGKDVGLDSIGRALNVRHILEGSVRKAGDRVRATAQLIDPSTGDHLWSETYERELRDLFQVENEIAREVVDQLQLELGGGRAGAVLAKEETKDPEAHLLLLRGRRLLRQFTREGVDQAEPLLKQAIARDPAYARAHAELAAVYRIQAEQGREPIEALMGQARAALERALELDPSLARAHYQEGWIAYGSGDRHAAEASFARAAELNPGYAPAHSMRAYLLAILGRPEGAIRAAEWTAALDPLSPARQADIAAVYIYARQYERAAEAYQSALALDPGRLAILSDLAFVYALMGRHAEAVRTAQQARDLAPEEQWPLTALGYAYARAGRRSEAEAALRTLEALPEPGSYFRAIAYAGLGERGRVFSLLEQSVAEKDDLVAGLGADPVFDPYRSDPRMDQLLKRLGLRDDSR
jgi:TolB-like protein/Tfp pilus assembly protein PilF